MCVCMSPVGVVQWGSVFKQLGRGNHWRGRGGGRHRQETRSYQPGQGERGLGVISE